MLTILHASALRVMPGRAAISFAAAATASWLLCDDATAAGLRGPVSTLGLLALAGPLLLLREWPSGFTGSWLAVGMLLAGVLWLCRTRPLPAWFFRSPAARVAVRWPSRRSPAPPLSMSDASSATLEAARRCFLELQAAWDAHDDTGLWARTTPEMYREIQAERAHLGSTPNRTDVLTLEAELLALETIGVREVASVAFSGMIRESAEAGAKPFREVWMLVRDAGADWRLARHQALL